MGRKASHTSQSAAEKIGCPSASNMGAGAPSLMTPPARSIGPTRSAALGSWNPEASSAYWPGATEPRRRCCSKRMAASAAAMLASIADALIEAAGEGAKEPVPYGEPRPEAGWATEAAAAPTAEVSSGDDIAEEAVEDVRDDEVDEDDDMDDDSVLEDELDALDPDDVCRLRWPRRAWWLWWW